MLFQVPHHNLNKVFILPVLWKGIILVQEQMLHDFPHALCPTITNALQFPSGSYRLCHIPYCMKPCSLQTVE